VGESLGTTSTVGVYIRFRISCVDIESCSMYIDLDEYLCMMMVILPR